MSNPYITGTANSVDSSMELGVPNFLQHVLHQEKSQLGRTNKMKAFLKSAAENLKKYRKNKHEMQIFESNIVRDMNAMADYYAKHPYPEDKTKQKSWLKEEVESLYKTNIVNMQKVGIDIKQLKITNITTPHIKHAVSVKTPVDIKRSEVTNRDDHERSRNPYNSMPSSDKQVIRKDPVLNRHGRDSPDIYDDDETDYYHGHGNGYDEYYGKDGTTKLNSQYDYRI